MQLVVGVGVVDEEGEEALDQAEEVGGLGLARSVEWVRNERVDKRN